MVKLEDGTGNGFSAKVNKKFRLETNGVQVSEPQQQTKEGNSYNVGTGPINLTTGGASAVLFIKNNEDFDLILELLRISLGGSTGGLVTEDFRIEIIRNPTVGTIVSAAVVASVLNRNFGSSNTITIDAFKGAEGNTLTDGLTIIDVLENIARADAGGLFISLPKGSSIGVRITPKASNTSMNVAIDARVMLDTFFEQSAG